MAAAGTLAVCVAATAVLATLCVGRGKPGWFDSVIDPRFQALRARFPAAVNWLPDLGTLTTKLEGVGGGVGVVAGQSPGCTGNIMRRFVAYRRLHARYEGSATVKTFTA